MSQQINDGTEKAVAGPLEDELLLDPFDERVKEVPRPPNKRLKVSRLYPSERHEQALIPDPELVKNYQFVTG